MKRKITSILVCLLILFAAIPVAASESGVSKTETVYGNLNSDGSVSALYVVNAFDAPTGTEVTDYGNYSEVKNLSGTEALNQNGESVTFTVSKSPFYYQGNCADTAIPWDIGIVYLLDGNEISAQDLAGKSGKLEIRISVSEGEEAYAGFFENYLMQISYSLDADRCTNLTGDQATIAVVGKTQNVSFTHMQNSQETYALSADVTDFEMGSIQFRAVKMSDMGIDADEISGLTDQMNQLADTIAALHETSAALSASSTKFAQSLASLQNALTQNASASGQLSNALQQASSGLTALSEQSDAQLTNAQSLLSDPNPQVQALAAAYIGQNGAIHAASDGMTELYGNYGEYDAGIQAVSQSAAKLAAAYQQIDKGIAGLSSALSAMDAQTAAFSAQIDGQISSLLQRYFPQGDVPSSFASDKNSAESVTFLLKTPSVSVAQQESGEEVSDVPATFWQRLIALFGR
ncbi:MAG: hypothetical protein ACC608_07370 [Anaerofustis sp.]